MNASRSLRGMCKRKQDGTCRFRPVIDPSFTLQPTNCSSVSTSFVPERLREEIPKAPSFSVV